MKKWHKATREKKRQIPKKNNQLELIVSALKGGLGVKKIFESAHALHERDSIVWLRG